MFKVILVKYFYWFLWLRLRRVYKDSDSLNIYGIQPISRKIIRSLVLCIFEFYCKHQHCGAVADQVNQILLSYLCIIQPAHRGLSEAGSDPCQPICDSTTPQPEIKSIRFGIDPWTNPFLVPIFKCVGVHDSICFLLMCILTGLWIWILSAAVLSLPYGFAFSNVFILF